MILWCSIPLNSKFFHVLCHFELQFSWVSTILTQICLSYLLLHKFCIRLCKKWIEFYNTISWHNSRVKWPSGHSCSAHYFLISLFSTFNVTLFPRRNLLKRLVVPMFKFYFSLTNPEVLFAEHLASCKIRTESKLKFPFFVYYVMKIWKQLMFQPAGSVFVFFIVVSAFILNTSWICSIFRRNSSRAFPSTNFSLITNHDARTFWISTASKFYFTILPVDFHYYCPFCFLFFELWFSSF